VGEYADSIESGVVLPPVIVFFDGVNNWLADGFHRYWALAKLGRPSIEAEIKHGTQRDAVLFSVGANSAHGQRRTNEDKRRAVMTLLNDEEWGKWSDVEVAKRCAVSHTTVQRIRSGLSPAQSASEPRTYKTKHGTRVNVEWSRRR
jgi:ParB-like chromosome segregation protein Spo0J